MSKDNVVLVSEYNMPDDFTCIWQKETKVNFDSNRKSGLKNCIYIRNKLKKGECKWIIKKKI